jgi:hypothetical protein
MKANTCRRLGQILQTLSARSATNERLVSSFNSGDEGDANREHWVEGIEKWRTGRVGSMAFAIMRLRGVIMLMSCTVPSLRVMLSKPRLENTEMSFGAMLLKDGNLMVRMGLRCGSEGSNMRTLPLSWPVSSLQGLEDGPLLAFDVISIEGCSTSVSHGSTHIVRAARLALQWYVSCKPYLHNVNVVLTKSPHPDGRKNA